MPSQETMQQAVDLFRQHGDILRTGESLALGIHPRTLYALRNAGLPERLERGLYRLAATPPLANPDLVTVAIKVPRGVICLVSALAYYELTTQVPHFVDLVLEQGSESPRLEYPPLRLFGSARPHGGRGRRPTR